MNGPISDEQFAERRAWMVTEQLRGRAIVDERVLEAMARIPREKFVAPALRDRAYDDAPLPIGSGQTISQPYMVARMLELLRLDGSERVLEIGAGSGYQTALLAELAAEVFAVERIPSLGEEATRRLAGCPNVEIGVFDGTHGWPEHAPFDRIIVAAAAPSIPALLVDQLAVGGRMVVPVGSRELQTLAIVTRTDDGYVVHEDTACTFVPLVGRYGWGKDGPPTA